MVFGWGREGGEKFATSELERLGYLDPEVERVDRINWTGEIQDDEGAWGAIVGIAGTSSLTTTVGGLRVRLILMVNIFNLGLSWVRGVK